MSGLRELNILLLTPQLPYPPEQGTSLRNYHILRGLAQEHRVHLLSFVEPDQRAELHIDRLQALCEEVITVPAPRRSVGQRLWRLLRDRRPDMAHRLQSASFEGALSKVLQRTAFDIVQIEGIELVSHIDLIRAQCPQCRIVFDNHNAEAELQRRMFVTDLRMPRRLPAAAYSLLQWRRLRHYERWACERADGVTVVSEADRSHLRALAHGIDAIVIPNCIDVTRYEEISRVTPEPDAHDLLFIGKMDYRPNVDAVLWFGDEIWPLIRAQRPQTTWAIVGKQPHQRLKSLMSQPGVTVTGSVPQIEPYLAHAKVYVMPFRIGSGTRLKLIEALASGVATVSTTVGAEGYPLRDGQELLLADEPQHFANAVVELLSQESKREQLQRAGREFAASYDWRQVVPRFFKLYERLVSA